MGEPDYSTEILDIAILIQPAGATEDEDEETESDENEVE